MACCSRRGELDLALEAVDVDALRQFGRQDLDDDLARPSAFFGDEDARHPAAAELALDGVGRAECGLQIRAEIHSR